MLLHPYLTPEYLRAAKAAPPPPSTPFPRRRTGPRSISILGLHLPMLSVKMLPYFVITSVCAAIEACHASMVEQGIELATRYGPESAVYDVDAPFAGYTPHWLRWQPDDRLRAALGWEVERMQRIQETRMASITAEERRVMTLITAQRLTQVYREIRRRHKAATARAWLREELRAMQHYAEKLAWLTRLVRESRERRARGVEDVSDLLAARPVW